MLSSRILLAAAVTTWLAIPAGAQTPPGNEPPPAAPSNIPGPTPPARTNPANPAPAPAPTQDRSVVPAAPAPAPAAPRRRPAAPAPTAPAPGTGSGDHAAPGAAAGRRPADPVRPAVQPPARMPPAGSPPVILTIAPCFETQGNVSVVEPETYLYYIADAAQPAVAEPVGALRRAAEERLRSDFRSLWATNFLDNLSIDVTDYTFPNGVIGKLVTYNMEERQRDQDRRLHGQQEDRVDQDRREAEGSKRHHPPRLVHRPRADPARRGHRAASMLSEKGFSTPRSPTRSSRSPGGPKTGQPHLHHQRRAEGQDSQDRLRRQQGVGDGKLKQADEGQQGAGPGCRSSPQQAAPTRKTSSTRTPRRSSATTATTATCAPASASPEAEDARGHQGRQDALRRAAHPGHRGPALQGRQLRASPATRWSRPRRCVQLFKLQAGRVLHREAGPRRASRRRARSTAPAATSSSPASRTSSFRDLPETPSRATWRRRSTPPPRPRPRASPVRPSST